VVSIPLVHRETGVEETWVLCPICAYAPDATHESRRLWRLWRPVGATMLR
jgi:hypothetical protein